MSSTGKITNLLPALSLPLSFQDWLPLAHFGVLTGFTAGALALRAAMLVAAMMLDRLIGEPDMLWNRLPHPVVLFGRIITGFDRLWNQRRRVSGRTRRCRGIITALALLVFCPLVVVVQPNSASVAASRNAGFITSALLRKC